MQPTEVSQLNLSKSDDRVGGKSRKVRIPLLSRFYAWSVVLEPMLFFIFFERTVTGVGGNFSRILQIIVIICLIFRLLAFLSKSVDIRVFNFTSPLFVNYGLYLYCGIVAGLVGLMSGTYSVLLPYGLHHNESGFSKFLNSAEFRPLFEYLIALYYFVYFVILPKYLLTTQKIVEYFLSTFKIVFVISFVIGVIDYGFSIFNIDLVPRHFSDWRHVGVRFHGLAGEPRDAFVYLFLGMAMLHLQAYFKGLTLSKWWVFAIITAATLTQSASGLLGIVCFLGLYGVYSTGRLTARYFVRWLAVITLTIALLYVNFVSSERIILYWEGASNVWLYLEAGAKLPFPMSVVANNIYPLYDLTVKIRDLNILPVLIGSGFGSSSAINNLYFGTLGEISNPNAQLVRVVFESGLIGIYLFIMSFAYPVKYLTKHIPKNKQHEFMLLTLLLIGCFLAHRSAASFIYLGIFIASFRTYRGIHDPQH